MNAIKPTNNIAIEIFETSFLLFISTKNPLFLHITFIILLTLIIYVYNIYNLYTF